MTCFSIALLSSLLIDLISYKKKVFLKKSVLLYESSDIITLIMILFITNFYERRNVRCSIHTRKSAQR